MPLNNSKSDVIAMRRQEIARLRLRGLTQREIVVALEQLPTPMITSVATVNRDLKELDKAWREGAGEAVDALKARELARIDLVESEYWAAWDRSKVNAETTVNRTKTVMLKDKTSEGIIELPAEEKEYTLTERGQSGDPRFLQGIMSCVETRLKIVGGFAPTKVDLTWKEKLETEGVDPSRVFEQLVEAAITRAAAADGGGSDSGGPEAHSGQAV